MSMLVIIVSSFAFTFIATEISNYARIKIFKLQKSVLLNKFYLKNVNQNSDSLIIFEIIFKHIVTINLNIYNEYMWKTYSILLLIAERKLKQIKVIIK